MKIIVIYGVVANVNGLGLAASHQRKFVVVCQRVVSSAIDLVGRVGSISTIQ